MPSVIPFGDEPIDTTLKRFKKRVIVSGILGELSRSRFYMTKSQKQRAKSAKARKRARRKERAERAAGRNVERDFKPWVTDTKWPPDMTLNPDSGEDGSSYFFRSNPSLVQEEPSDFVCTVGTFTTDQGELITVLVKDDPENSDGKGKSDRYGFPGGGVKVGETREAGAVREYQEESGLDVRKPTAKNIVFQKTMGVHTFTCYRAPIIGGQIVKGKEIEEIEIVKMTELRGWIAQGRLLNNHRLAAEALLQKMGM